MSHRLCTRNASGGFTLVEVLLAISLVGMLAGGVVAFLSQLADRRVSMELAASELRAGGAMIERIEQDLLGAVAAARGQPSGIVGTGATLRIATRGVWIDLTPGEAEEDGEPATLLAGMSDGDLQMSEYRFEADGGRVQARRWAAGGTGSGGGGASDGPTADTLASRVQRARFRYHDGRAWVDVFDSAQAGGLPTAVEVAVWFGEPVVSEAGAGPRRWPEPDRLRVIVVPDGPGMGAVGR